VTSSWWLPTTQKYRKVGRILLNYTIYT